MAWNVFVLGLNPFNLEKLRSIRRFDACTFHGLLDTHALKDADEYAFAELLAEAERTLDAFPGRVDAIINFWDFPASALHAILCERYGVPGPALESVIKCAHKYWSRREQAEVVPENVPNFHAFDPFDDPAAHDIPLAFPFWIKPVLSYSGYLGFRVENQTELEASLGVIRERIHRYAEPFRELLQEFELPQHVSHVDAGHCLAEEIMSGDQCTVEGYARGGTVTTYGIVDSHRFSNNVSFSRYQYPSRLPDEVQARIHDVSRRVIRHLEYEDAAFNIEFFHHAETDSLKLLEINTRVSQSHSDLFEKVDGRSNHEAVVEVALGHEPEMPYRRGKHAVAGKLFVRRFQDGIVRHAPGPEDIRRVEEAFPGTIVQVPVSEGMRLSEILDQDSYSHQLAIVYAGAQSEEELLDTRSRIEEMLDFHVEPLASVEEEAV